jgi:hypothetical protein
VNAVKPFLREATRSVRLVPAAILALSLGTIGACGGKKTGPGFDNTDGGGAGSSGGSGDDSGIVSFGDDGGVLNLPEASTGPSVTDAGCAKAMSQAHFAAVYLLFVLDGSGSMNQNNKWTAVVPALKDIFMQMAGQNDPGLGAGLIIFSDTNDTSAGAGPYPSSNDVPVGLMNGAQNSKLATRLSGMPAASTPTQAAMTGGYTELENFTPQAPLTTGGKKVLVLITDGAPSDGCSILSSAANGYTMNACVVMAGQKLMEAAPKGPIETFVIGVGQFPSTIALTFDPSFLGYVAQAGGTGPAMCNPTENTTTSDLCYFEIDPTTATSATQLQQRFETALNTIRGQVLSCTFPIEKNVSGVPFDKANVNVDIGGMTILKDPKNGWSFDNDNNPTEIILNGAACTKAKGGITEKVQVVLGCPTAVPM